MLMPEKMLEKALYWGPLLTGVICLIAGIGVLKSPFMVELSAHIEASRIERARRAGHVIPPQRYAANLNDLKALAKRTRKHPKPVDDTEAARFDKGGQIAGYAGAFLADPLSHGGDAGQAYQQRFLVSGFAGLLGRAAQPGMDGVPLAMINGPRLLLRGAVADWAADQGLGWAHGEGVLFDGIAPVAGWPLIENTRVNAQNLGKMQRSVVLAALGGEKAGAHYNFLFYGRQLGKRQGGLASSHFHSLNDLGSSAGSIINFQDFGRGLADQPEIVMNGLAVSQSLTRLILRREQSTTLGVALSRPFISYVSLGLGGLEGAARRYEARLGRETVPSKAAFKLPVDLRGPAGETTCANDAFYRVVKYLQKSRLTPLKTTLKLLFNGKKSRSQRWIFKPLSLQASRRCARWKVYRSGRRKCLKWSKPTNNANDHLSKRQRRIVLSAHKLVSSGGSSAYIKRRSNNGWVLTRINQDLQFYSRQPEHPAICTGALRMVDYFDNHLGRVRRMIDDRLAVLSEVQLLLSTRQSFLSDMLFRSRKLADLERNIFGGETRVASIYRGRTEMIRDQAEAPLPPGSVMLDDIVLEDLQAGILSLSRALWGERAAREIKSANGVLAALALAHHYHKQENFIVELTPAVRRDVRQLFVLIEAAHYLKQRHEMYQELNDQLFGSLSLLRQAHKQHCQCAPSAGD